MRQWSIYLIKWGLIKQSITKGTLCRVSQSCPNNMSMLICSLLIQPIMQSFFWVRFLFTNITLVCISFDYLPINVLMIFNTNLLLIHKSTTVWSDGSSEEQSWHWLLISVQRFEGRRHWARLQWQCQPVHQLCNKYDSDSRMIVKPRAVCLYITRVQSLHSCSLGRRERKR